MEIVKVEVLTMLPGKEPINDFPSKTLTMKWAQLGHVKETHWKIK